MTPSAGIPLGYYFDKRRPPGQEWRHLAYSDDRHVVTIAPTRTGKGTTVIMPTLLAHDASCFVTDPKGELAAVTARQRQRLGHQVFILNPFGVLQQEFAARGFPASHRFNPLALLDPASPSFVAAVARLGEALVQTEGNDPHWSNAARDLVTAFIMHICTEGKERTLSRVRQLLAAPWHEFQSTLADMYLSDFPPLKQRAGRFLVPDPTTEIQGVIATAITQTSFLDDPAIAACLDGDDFHFIDLKRQKITVYLVLAAKDIPPYAKWLRLLLTAALDELMATEEKGHKPVLFLLDEFANLGHLAVVETAMALAAGYGLQMWPIVQDINQLKATYSDRWETFLANAGVTQYFTPNDMTTAEYLSRRCGHTTVEVQSTGHREVSSREAEEGLTGRSVSINRQQRPLRFPEDFYDMDNDQQLIFYAGLKSPIPAARFPYFAKAEEVPQGVTTYTGLYDINPYHRGR
ncbi:MAG: type IV secretory system conjugative DNA transfer family protein [Acidobacteria bacterium]|nr:type IV secretory system conjugative DNA transfer family protein [Acidobacteriota bacterium]